MEYYAVIRNATTTRMNRQTQKTTYHMISHIKEQKKAWVARRVCL